MTTNEQLVELERDLESDLLEARRDLEEGRREAIGKLDALRDELGGRADAAVDYIRRLALQAEEDLQLVQGRLGELNYVLAEEKMNDLETFDRYRDRILEAMTTAKDDMSALKTSGNMWSQYSKECDDAWHQLSRGFDSVRTHLIYESRIARGEFDAGRKRLSESLHEKEAHPSPPQRHLVGRLKDELNQALPGIKAMFLVHDEPEGEDAAPGS